MDVLPLNRKIYPNRTEAASASHSELLTEDRSNVNHVAKLFDLPPQEQQRIQLYRQWSSQSVRDGGCAEPREPIDAQFGVGAG